MVHERLDRYIITKHKSHYRYIIVFYTIGLENKMDRIYTSCISVLYSLWCKAVSYSKRNGVLLGMQVIVYEITGAVKRQLVIQSSKSMYSLLL